MQTKTLVATITHIDRVPGLIELETADRRCIAMPVVMLAASRFDCADLLSVGDRLRVCAKLVMSYEVERVVGIVPKSSDKPRGTREPHRRKATREVLRLIERARFGLEAQGSRVTDGGVLAHPHAEWAALQVAGEELAKAAAIIERVWGPIEWAGTQT